jgi:hypothetical protein
MELKRDIPKGIRIRAFFMTSLLSILASVLIFVFLVKVELFDGVFGSFLKASGGLKPILALAAASPLFASLLVGYGYMTRAMRRRAAQKKAQATGAS